MFLIEAPPQITTIQTSESITPIQSAESQMFILFDDYVIPNFASNEEAIEAGLNRFELWRSPDNKINIVKYRDFFTGFNVNLSRALSYFRRMF